MSLLEKLAPARNNGAREGESPASVPAKASASSASSVIRRTGLQGKEGICSAVPAAWTAFVDAFLDHAVGGYVLGPTSSSAEASGDPVVTFRPAPERIVAIGDLHGDLPKFKEALTVAGVIDAQDNWSGGETVLVQVGDQLDRGDQELSVLYLLEKLRREAPRSGGAVYVLHGNHETGNMNGWLKYASPGGLLDFQRWASWQRVGNRLKGACEGNPTPPDPVADIKGGSAPEAHRARYAALRPGGALSSRLFASHHAVLVLGDSVFVHGGLLPEHVHYGLEKMNREAREWVLWTDDGHARHPPPPPKFFQGPEAVVWLREYSHVSPSKCNCSLLADTLELLPGVRRMIMGHTIQQPGGINAVCDGRAVRIDVGMSKGCYDAAPEVLELERDGTMRVLSNKAPPRLIGLQAVGNHSLSADIQGLFQSSKLP